MNFPHILWNIEFRIFIVRNHCFPILHIVSLQYYNKFYFSCKDTRQFIFIGLILTRILIRFNLNSYSRCPISKVSILHAGVSRDELSRVWKEPSDTNKNYPPIFPLWPPGPHLKVAVYQYQSTLHGVNHITYIVDSFWCR